jgi:hypothetical protein
MVRVVKKASPPPMEQPVQDPALSMGQAGPTRPTEIGGPPRDAVFFGEGVNSPVTIIQKDAQGIPRTSVLSRDAYKAMLKQQGGGFRGYQEAEKLTPQAAELARLADPAVQRQIEAEQAEQERLNLTQGLRVPDISTLGPDERPASPDALDLLKAGGGAVGGGFAGAKIGGLIGTAAAPGVGTLVGGIAGGLIGGAAAFFWSTSSDRKQQVRVAKKEISESKAALQKIQNNANSGIYSRDFIDEAWEYEWALIEKKERELRAQQNTLFGEKLSQSRDELVTVRRLLEQKQQKRVQLELAMLNPNPNAITAVTEVEEEESSGFFSSLFG